MDTDVDKNNTYKYLLIYAKRNTGMLNKKNGYLWGEVGKNGEERTVMKTRLLRI